MTIEIKTKETDDQSDKNNNTIYTRDEAALILEMFENILCDRGIKIKCKDEMEQKEREENEENGAALYGTEYYGLLDEIEGMLIEILERRDSGASVETDAFSGTT